jgi:hypothetical protein
MAESKEIPTLFTVWDTPVKVHPGIMANLAALWGLLVWWAGRRQPERPWPLRIALGFLETLVLLSADVGHAMAHIVSARFAGAPMDEIVVSSGMPRTLYCDNDVLPRVHRLRALGGPIYSALGLLLSLVLRALSPRGTAMREITDASCLGHGFILLGSLAPLPFVDGGCLVKWTLVEAGRSEAEADALVKTVDLALGTASTTTGVLVAATRRGQPARQRWLPALGLVAAGGIAIAAALDKIR